VSRDAGWVGFIACLSQPGGFFARNSKSENFQEILAESDMF